jgi:nucleotide-binding universal stress UspA family protein
MFNTVVWATDGSEDAIRALPYAKALATGEGAMLLVVHIVQEPGTAAAEGDAAVDSDQSGSHSTVREVLADLSQQGLNAILKVVDFVGPQPAQGIADIAAEVDADVIVVGTRGHSAIGGLLAGSVTQHLLHVAPCPVLAVPPPLTQRNDAEQAVKPADATG